MTGGDLHLGDGGPDESDIGPKSLETDRAAEWLDRVTALPDESFVDDDIEDPELARLLLRWRRETSTRTSTCDSDQDRCVALVAYARRRRVRTGPLVAAASVSLLIALGLAVLSSDPGAGGRAPTSRGVLNSQSEQERAAAMARDEADIALTQGRLDRVRSALNRADRVASTPAPAGAPIPAPTCARTRPGSVT